MDFLNFVIALYGALYVDIPEADDPKLDSSNACADHLTSLLSAKTERPGEAGRRSDGDHG